jgi:hypothetical protein
MHFLLRACHVCGKESYVIPCPRHLRIAKPRRTSCQFKATTHFLPIQSHDALLGILLAADSRNRIALQGLTPSHQSDHPPFPNSWHGAFGRGSAHSRELRRDPAEGAIIQHWRPSPHWSMGRKLSSGESLVEDGERQATQAFANGPRQQHKKFGRSIQAAQGKHGARVSQQTAPVKGNDDTAFRTGPHSMFFLASQERLPLH